MGRMGCCIGLLIINDYLRYYRFYPLFPGKSVAPILQAAVQNGYGTADRRLWKPQLLEQYCGQGDVYFDERDPGAPGR